VIDAQRVDRFVGFTFSLVMNFLLRPASGRYRAACSSSLVIRDFKDFSSAMDPNDSRPDHDSNRTHEV
jgi:hypothetical protein